MTEPTIGRSKYPPTVRGRTFLVRESFAELMRPTTDDAPRAAPAIRLRWYRLLIAFMAGLCVPTVCALVALWLLR